MCALIFSIYTKKHAEIKFYLHKYFCAAGSEFYLHKDFRAAEIEFYLHKVVYRVLHRRVPESRGGIGEFAPTGVPAPSVEDAGQEERLGF